MSTSQVTAEQIINAALDDAALARQLKTAIQEHLTSTRDIRIVQGRGSGIWYVYQDKWDGNTVWRGDHVKLVSSASYAACVEFALKLPIRHQPAERG